MTKRALEQSSPARTTGRPGAEAQSVDKECYVVLQHARTLAEAQPGAGLTAEQIAQELGYTRREAHPLFERLVSGGYLAGHLGEGALSLTPKGLAYLERADQRRRGVRGPRTSA